METEFDSSEKVQPASWRPGRVLLNENGRIGYIIAWLLGVPASVLFLVFLLRGH